MQWFGPDEALAARAAGEIELAPPQYVTLLDLREYATVADAMAGVAAARADRLHAPLPLHRRRRRDLRVPRRRRVRRLARLDADGPRHRLYLGDAGWDYIRD